MEELAGPLCSERRRQLLHSDEVYVMDRWEKAIFTNMCMIEDRAGNVLVQDRVDSSWGGITFPGGHVEKGEDFADAVVREVWEETGLTIRCPKLCGIKQWTRADGSRYVVFCYKTDQFCGDLVSSAEGEMSWVRLDELPQMNLASGMAYMLRLFLDDEVSEHCIHREDGTIRNILK